MVPLDHVKRHVVNLRFVVKSTTLVQVRQIFPLFLPEFFFSYTRLLKAKCLPTEKRQPELFALHLTFSNCIFFSLIWHHPAISPLFHHSNYEKVRKLGNLCYKRNEKKEMRAI